LITPKIVSAAFEIGGAIAPHWLRAWIQILMSLLPTNYIMFFITFNQFKLCFVVILFIVKFSFHCISSISWNL